MTALAQQLDSQLDALEIDGLSDWEQRFVADMRRRLSRGQIITRKMNEGIAEIMLRKQQ